MSNRLDYLDEMRGLAILFVCMGHIYGPHSSLGNLQPGSEIISSFHMSFFFFLSGYINRQTHKIDNIGTFGYIKKKIQALMIPHFFWLYVAGYFLYDQFPSSMNEFLLMLNFYPNVNEWFLPCLFFAMMLWLLAYLIEYKNGLGGARLVVLYLFLPIGLCAIGLCFHLFFFLIYAIYMSSFLFGDFLSRSEKLKIYILADRTWIAVTLLLCVVWKIYVPESDGGGVKSIIMLSLYFLSSLGACVFFYNFFRKVELTSFIKKPLIEWGKMSIVIYLLPIFLLPSDFSFPSNWTMTMINLFVLLIGIAQCCISSLVGEAIMKIPGLRFVMFGKM